jgi:hypothetical protein
MKIRKSPHSTRPAFQPKAQHYWLGPVTQWPSRRGERVPGVVTTQWPHVWPPGGAAGQGSPAAPMQHGWRREHEDGEGKSPGKKDGNAAHQGGSGANKVADGAARRRFFEGSDAPVSFDDGGGVLQHGGVEGGREAN